MEQLLSYLSLDKASSAIAAFVILFVGWALAKFLRRAVRGSKFGGQHIDSTLRPVLASALFYIVVSMTFYAFLTRLGIPAQSLLAVFGAAGLAIGLALKDTLSNIASGLMMLTLRPSEVGEFIDTDTAAGTVEEVGLFATTIRNSEGILIYIPNRQIWHSRITNYSRHTERRLSVDINVAYGTDLPKAQAVLLKVLSANALVLDAPTPPQCFVTDLGERAVKLTTRCWLPADDWTQNTSDIRIALTQALDKAGIDIAVPLYTNPLKSSSAK